MPSQKVLEQKQQIVAELADRIQNSVAGVIVDYKGITVEDDTKLRKELRESGVKYTVIKNTLIKRAADKAGLSGMDDVLNGTSAIATSAEDYVAAARILQKFADTHEHFTVKTGYLDNEVITVENEKAFEIGGEFPSIEGALVGISSGAALAAAIELAGRPENKGKNIVALLPDSGDRYLSTAMLAK